MNDTRNISLCEALNIHGLPVTHPLHPLQISHSVMSYCRVNVRERPEVVRNVLHGQFNLVARMALAPEETTPNQLPTEKLAAAIIVDEYFACAGDFEKAVANIERTFALKYEGNVEVMRESSARVVAAMTIQNVGEQINGVQNPH